MPPPGPSSRPSPPARNSNALERIIGTSDLIRAGFLADGERTACSVCRIEIGEPSGLVAGYGTSMMISPQLRLTNNHVLDSPHTAAASFAEFGYEANEDGELLPSIRFALAPATLFVTDPMLNYTVVAVRPGSTNGRSLVAYGWVPLIAQ